MGLPVVLALTMGAGTFGTATAVAATQKVDNSLLAFLSNMPMRVAEHALYGSVRSRRLIIWTTTGHLSVVEMSNGGRLGLLFPERFERGRRQ